ncbi:MAG: hypothetical protein ACRDYE_15185 [Acidimicrobiales bacterium]
MASSGRTVANRPIAATAVAFAGWVIFATYLLVQANAGPLIAWNDSKSYAAMAVAPLGSHALWWGQRPPMLPLLIKAFGSDGGLLTAQAVIGALSWGVLAWTVGRLVEPGWRRATATWLVLGFATALPITVWNRSMLSESLSMSLLALVVAGLIGTARRATWPRVAATAAAALCFATTRDAQAWTVAMLGMALAVLVLAPTWTTPRAAVRAGTLAGCLLVVAGVAGWGSLVSHRTTANVADVFYVRVFPFPSRVAWFAGHGMPEQQLIDREATATRAAPGSAKVVYLPPGDPAFGAVEHWLGTDGPSAYVRWLGTHPWYVMTEPLLRPERSYNFAHGSLTFYAGPDDMASPLTPLVWPPLAELAVLAAGAGYLAFRRRAWHLAPWRMMAVVAAVGLPAMLIAWHGDGQEVTRHTVEGFAQVRLGIWLLIVYGLLVRRSERDRGRPVASAPGAAGSGDADPAPGAGSEPAPPHRAPREPAGARPELAGATPADRARPAFADRARPAFAANLGRQQRRP